MPKADVLNVYETVSPAERKVDHIFLCCDVILHTLLQRYEKIGRENKKNRRLPDLLGSKHALAVLASLDAPPEAYVAQILLATLLTLFPRS